jgi:putative ABC transport system permease protein
MKGLLQDVRYGLRLLVKSPGFTAVAVITLALGIGANTAIFSVVKAVLLHALPFKEADRLVMVRETVKNHGTNPVGLENFRDWQTQNTVFERMAAYSDAEFIVSGADRSERIYGEEVTENYFEILGITAVQGRTFLPEENQTPMKDMVALIGYGLWQRRFGSDPSIVGKQIRLNNANFTIVGVLPKGFVGLSDSAEAWIPVMVRDAAWPAAAKFDFLHNRGVHWLNAIATLKPAVSLAQARVEMKTIADRLAAVYPEENRDRSATVLAAKDVYVHNFRSPLYILSFAVGFVLLIGCANVANLVLTRTAYRDREIAIRLSLGAGRARLVRQFVTETLLLSCAGAAVGLLLADWGLGLLVAILPVSFPSFTQVRLDGGVLAFTCLLTIVTGVVLGLLPALSAGRESLNETLKEGAKGSAGLRGRKIGTVLVVTEMAMAMVLLAGAGLLIKSLERLIDVNPGFQPDHLLTMRFYVPDRHYEGDGRNRFGPQLAEQIASVPGVESAAVTFIDPFIWSGFSRGFTLEGHAAVSTAEQDSVYYQEVGPNYFHTMGIPLLSGRDFSMRDSQDAPHVVMVSEAFARRFWPGENAIGKRIKYGPPNSPQPWMQVVGVVGNIKFASLRQDPNAEPVFYGPLLQSEATMNMSVIVRTRPAPESMIAPLRSAIQKIDPEIPVYNVATIADRMHEDSAETRSYTLLMSLFALLALSLAAIGIYGVMAYAVTRRVHEIGIRLALGAQQKDVLRLVLGRGLWIALAGVAFGLAGSVALTRAMAGLLYDVTPTDPAILAGVSILLSLVALLACYAPARRATRIDPIVALRYE